MSVSTTNNREIKEKLCALYDELFGHDGYGDMRVEMRLLNRGHKEVIICCGKQFRYVVAYQKPGKQIPRGDDAAGRVAERSGN